MVTIMGSHGSDFIASKCSRWMRSLTRWSERSLFSERFLSLFDPARSGPVLDEAMTRTHASLVVVLMYCLPKERCVYVTTGMARFLFHAVSALGFYRFLFDCLRRLLCYHHQPSPDWTWTDSVQAIYPRRWGQLSELLISEICTQPIA